MPGFFNPDGPFVYRLGRKIFILERGVRFPYGLLQKVVGLLIIRPLCFYPYPPAFFAIFTPLLLSKSIIFTKFVSIFREIEN